MTARTHALQCSASAALAAGLLLLFLYLGFRNTGLYPTIFSDETSYSTFARLAPFREATVPSYLYFLLFRGTSSCGDGFLDCARLLNVTLLLSAAPLIYLVARRVTTPALACTCALVSVAGPINLYTMYFMPEASYFLGFWALTWALLRHHEAPSAAAATLAGAILGLLTLVKVHGLFLLPAVCLFVAWTAQAGRTAGAAWKAEGVRHLAVLLATAALLRFGIAYLLAGPSGMNLFGSLYRSQANQSPAAGRPLLVLALQSLGVLRGHVLALTVLCGVPLISLLAFGASHARRKAAPTQLRALALYSVLVLVSLLAVTVLFTVSVSGLGFETDRRLHMRYYDFALPLLTIFAAAQTHFSTPAGWRCPLAVIAGAIIFYAASSIPRYYTPMIADSPALHGLTLLPRLFPWWCALLAASLLVWAIDARRGALWWVCALMPALAAGSALALNGEIRWALTADPYVNGARFARDYLAPEALDKLTVIGASEAGLQKSRFFLSTTGAPLRVVADTARFDVRSVLDQKNWFLVIGKLSAAPGLTVHRLEGRGYTLFKPRRPDPPGTTIIDFSQQLEDEGVASASGLSQAEAFGRWSDGKQVELAMGAALPKHVQMAMTVEAYGPNAGRDVVVTIGGQEQRFAAPAQLETVTLDFETSGEERLIRITVPEPASPRQLGKGDDPRALGLGFHQMRLNDQLARSRATP